jgi:hypothetical protein
MEKWIPSLPLWKRVSARGKPQAQKKGALSAVSHRPLPFPTAAKASRAPLSHRPCGESFYLQNLFLFLTQPDISLATKSGHFHLLITPLWLDSLNSCLVLDLRLERHTRLNGNFCSGNFCRASCLTEYVEGACLGFAHPLWDRSNNDSWITHIRNSTTIYEFPYEQKLPALEQTSMAARQGAARGDVLLV